MFKELLFTIDCNAPVCGDIELMIVIIISVTVISAAAAALIGYAWLRRKKLQSDR